MVVAEPPERYRRRSTRLAGHDHRGGLYFVTICTAMRLSVFGHVEKGTMVLSSVGRLVHHAWTRTPDIRPDVAMDAFVVMPDHVHLLFGLYDGDTLTHRGVSRYAPTPPVPGGARTFVSPSRTVGAVIRGFKGAATAQANRLRQTPGAPLWQRGYHDRVIRTDREAEAVRRYIARNPARWA